MPPVYSEQLQWLLLPQQVKMLFVLAIPVACIAWTITQEEIFREPREYCLDKSKSCKSLWQRKFFYLFTCHYCFSHYVVIALLIITGFKMMYTDWRGYLISGFSLVWIGNLYMSIYAFLRYGMKHQKMEANIKEAELEEVKEDVKEDKKPDDQTQSKI